jgi:DNA-binding transcriptional LysR family regulator
LGTSRYVVTICTIAGGTGTGFTLGDNRVGMDPETLFRAWAASGNLRARLQAAIQGIGIALLPEQVVAEPLKEGLVDRVLPEWSGAKNLPHLVYPTPRGMLPSVRSLIRT